MNKTQTYIHHGLCLVAFTLGFGVVTHSAHMKDVTTHALGTAYTSSAAMEAVKKAETINPHLQGTKVTADLHNHIEKQTFSSMVKSMSDDTNRQGSRQLKRDAKKKMKQLLEEEYIEPDTTSYKELFQRALGLI